MLVTSILSFSHSVFYPSKTNFNLSVTFMLLSASAFNLYQSKYLLFGKDLNLVPNNPSLIDPDTQYFFLFPQCFLSHCRKNSHLATFVICIRFINLCRLGSFPMPQDEVFKLNGLMVIITLGC